MRAKHRRQRPDEKQKLRRGVVGWKMASRAQICIECFDGVREIHDPPEGLREGEVSRII